MEYKHNKETEHEVEEEAHEECLEIVDELLSHVEEFKYPEHVIELVKGLKGELEEDYEDGEMTDDPREMDDEELEEKHWKSEEEKEKKK